MIPKQLIPTQERYNREYKKLYKEILKYAKIHKPSSVEGNALMWEEPMIFFNLKYYKVLSFDKPVEDVKIIMLSDDDGFVSFVINKDEKPLVFTLDINKHIGCREVGDFY